MADPPNHFFKFISPNSKFNLSIPKSFLTKLGGKKLAAVLRRGCHKWSVDIGDGAVFGDGTWRKLVVENGVQEFDIIVFKHQGDMVFDFLVFDPSGCERQYPYLPDHVEDHIPESDSLHIHERSKILLNKRKRTDNSPHGKDEVRLDSHHQEKKPTNTHMQVKKDSTSSAIHSSTPYFISTMKPYSFKRSCLYLQAEFSIQNELTTGEMILIDDNGRSWKVQLNKLCDNRLYLGCGLRDFLVANGFSKGDEYKFELIENHKNKPPVVKFSYLGNKLPVTNHTQVKKKTRLTIKNVTDSGLGNHRCFISTMRLSFRRSGLYLPVEFWRSNGLKVGEMILQDDKGRSWTVELNKHGKNRLYIGRGFKDFWVGSGLTEGNAYKFELAENEEDKPPVVNFSYQGKRAVKNHIQLHETRSSIKKVIGSTLVQKEKCKPHIMKVNVDTTPSEIEDRPCYIGEVKSYYIEQSMLYFPSKFAVKNGLLNKQEMIVKNEDERSWTVDIKRTGNYCYIKRGLKDFYSANGLKEGNLFKLELISNGEIPVANIYVQKAH